MYNDKVNIKVYICKILFFTFYHCTLTTNTKCMFSNEPVVFKSFKIAFTQRVYANYTE